MRNKRITKIITGALVFASMMAIKPVGVEAAWKENNSGWWYTEGESWATGWRLIDGKWYYFSPTSGYMAQSTTVNGYFVGSDGAWIDDSSFNISAAKAEELAKNKLQSRYGYVTKYVETCKFDENEWLVHCYNINRIDDKYYHTMTTNWYLVDKDTGAIRSMF